MASDPAFGCDRVRRQLDHSHVAPHPQKRLPPAARGRQSARHPTRGGRDSWPDLPFPVLHAQRDEVPCGSGAVQPRPHRPANCDPQWTAGDGEISGAVVPLLRIDRGLCRLPDRTHSEPRHSVPKRVPCGRCDGLPGIRCRTDPRLDLERPVVERDLKARLRRPDLWPAHCRHVRLALAEVNLIAHCRVCCHFYQQDPARERRHRVSEPTTSSTRRRRRPMRNRAINDVKHPPSCGVHWRNLQLHSLIAIAALLLLMSRAAAQAGTTYYVSTSGSDTNPGTIGAPWRTIQHAASTIHAVATVDVRAGVYNESVSIPVSGSSSSGYIVFQSYPGELA